jgi:DNA-binding winged helix-turn-helix (wHTH) protein
VLSEHEEGADKETLVRKAWGQDEYHPLRDDGKLHVAVRKLREVIEDDAKNPVRLATTEDGYRLGGRVRRIPAA